MKQGLDGCFLKGYYGGMILAAVGKDPNEQMLLIVIAVVEGETRDSWTWFLELLINDLGGKEWLWNDSKTKRTCFRLLKLKGPLWKKLFGTFET